MIYDDKKKIRIRKQKHYACPITPLNGLRRPINIGGLGRPLKLLLRGGRGGNLRRNGGGGANLPAIQMRADMISKAIATRHSKSKAVNRLLSANLTNMHVCFKLHVLTL